MFVRGLTLIAWLQPVSFLTLTLSFVIKPPLSDSLRLCVCGKLYPSHWNTVFSGESSLDWSRVTGLDRDVEDGQRDSEENG